MTIPTSPEVTDFTDFQDVGIATEDLGPIARALSMQYSRPRVAVIRELAVNGVEATRRAGSSAPVEITLPSEGRPVLTVVDHGTGMSLAEVETNIRNYGASTKRREAATEGGFGIGGKAPFAVAGYYRISTVQDGFLTEVILAVTPSGTVGTKIESHRPTMKPNGTVVDVPVEVEDQRRYNHWLEAAKEALFFFDAGAVVVATCDGLTPAALPSWERTIDEASSHGDVKWLGAGHISSGFVRMGSIGYPTQRLHPGVVVDLPTSTFPLLPSREALMDVQETWDHLEEKQQEWMEAVAAKFRAAFGGVQSVLEAYRVLKGQSDIAVWCYEQSHPELAGKWSTSRAGLIHTLMPGSPEPEYEAVEGFVWSRGHTRALNLSLFELQEAADRRWVIVPLGELIEQVEMDETDRYTDLRTWLRLHPRAARVINAWRKHNPEISIVAVRDLDALGHYMRVDDPFVEVLTLQDLRDDTPKSRPAAATAFADTDELPLRWGPRTLTVATIRERVAQGDRLIVGSAHAFDSERNVLAASRERALRPEGYVLITASELVRERLALTLGDTVELLAPAALGEVIVQQVLDENPTAALRRGLVEASAVPILTPFAAADLLEKVSQGSVTMSTDLQKWLGKLSRLRKFTQMHGGMHLDYSASGIRPPLLHESMRLTIAVLGQHAWSRAQKVEVLEAVMVADKARPSSAAWPS